MGLSVMAYNNLKILHAVGETYEEGMKEDVDVVFYKNPHFPAQYEGLVEKAGYEGTYFSGPDFSYGGYGKWRDDLAKMAGYTQREFKSHESLPAQMLFAADCWMGATGPFAELINFSDCEGSIGPVVSKKLLVDFIEYDHRAKELGEWFYKQYSLFRDTFAHAAKDGGVRFG